MVRTSRRIGFLQRNTFPIAVSIFYQGGHDIRGIFLGNSLVRTEYDGIVSGTPSLREGVLSDDSWEDGALLRHRFCVEMYI